MGPAVTTPAMEVDRVVTADGYALPLRAWLPEGSDTSGYQPAAVMLAVHGFNDYGNAFDSLEDKLVGERDMALYAYDQRGFGAAHNPGIWAGSDTLVDDLHTVVNLLRERYPDTPLFLMGESMGAAVVMLTLDRHPELAVDGAILLSPAVWGLDTMPWYQRFGLWLGMRLMPERTFSGEVPRRLGITPSDDEEIMRELALDPLVLKDARVDTLYGVTLLMGEASRVHRLPVPALVLYGDNDQVIPPRPVCQWLQALEPEPERNQMIALYPDGYHMLTRYSGRGTVIADIAHWVVQQEAAMVRSLPSGHDSPWADAVEEVCEW